MKIMVPVFAACSLLLLGYSTSPLWLARTPAPDMEAEFREEVAEFDSFSRDAIALAVLRQAAQKCLLDCLERSRTGGRSGEVTGKPLEAAEATRDPILPLTTAITELKQDMDRKLLLVYFQKNLSNQFLNCYLNVLEESPDGDVVAWGHYALLCAEQCGRSYELLDAVRHVIRFHPEAKGRAGLEGLLRSTAPAVEVSANRTHASGSQ